MSERLGVPATHLQPRPREPTRLMKTFFSLFSWLPGEPRLLRPPWGRERLRSPGVHIVQAASCAHEACRVSTAALTGARLPFWPWGCVCTGWAAAHRAILDALAACVKAPESTSLE